jgi:hypothetical protein
MSTVATDANEVGRTAIPEKYFDYEGAVEHCHRRGVKHVTARTLEKAAYEGSRPLRRTKIGGRIYFARSDLDAWLASGKMDD